MATKPIPILFEWAGGMPALEAADPKAPMPHWNWGPPSGPYQR
jgi:hypothetical protein